MSVKVGINGYGTIGKRVADAVSKQDDMEVAGVTKTRPTWEAKFAIKKGYKLFCGVPENCSQFEEAGIKLEGTTEDLLEISDIIVDCTPKKLGAENKKKYYVPKKKKAIYQGAEKPEVAQMSFVAQCNYKEAIGKDHVRVVSCNTTGLSRALNALKSNFKIGKSRVFLVRRSADPGVSKKGPINAIIPNPIYVPSHHGPDVLTVLPDLDIVTSAVKVSTTLMHLHSLMVELKENVKEKQVIGVFKKTPRMELIKSSDGLLSTAEVVEYARDMGRPRYDLYENMVWEDSIGIKDKELYIFQAIGQEAIVIPGNIDCIRAMMELESDPMKSIQKTDKTLGIV